jgi:hypothetical protein
MTGFRKGKTIALRFLVETQGTKKQQQTNE